MTGVKQALAAACDDARQARHEGRLDEAIRCYARATAMAREHGDAHLAVEAGEEARTLYRAEGVQAGVDECDGRLKALTATAA